MKSNVEIIFKDISNQGIENVKNQKDFWSLKNAHEFSRKDMNTLYKTGERHEHRVNYDNIFDDKEEKGNIWNEGFIKND